MLAVWRLAALACLLGRDRPAGAGGHDRAGGQLLDLVRVAAPPPWRSSLLLGPGSSGGR